MRPLASLPTAFLALSFASAAQAEGPPDIAGFSLDPSAIYGGEDTAVCGWPTTVSMLGACTGTLVHPQLVIFAAHCGSGYDSLTLGESVDNPTRYVQTEYCRTYPGGGPGNGQDFAFCKLAQPQDDVPIVPILMGCEVDEYLQVGQEVTIVGFGNADTGPYGIKREVVTTITGFQNNEAYIGGNGKDSCQGDSGGPVYVKLKDGSWRVFGITSYGGACGTGGVYSMMHNGIQWFEQESGLDLTPCHNADGTWAPDPARCRSFPTDPGAGGFQWASGCSGGPVGGLSETCGVQCKPEDDLTAPTTFVTSPADDTVVYAPDMMANVKVPVTIDAQDVGCGVQEVRLLINGGEIGMGTDNAAPYEFTNVSWPTGCFEVGAKAIDFAGNEALAEPHTLCINMELPPPPPPPPDTDTDTDGGTGEPTTGATGDGSDSSDPTNASASASASASAGSTVGLTDGDGGDDSCDCRSGQGGSGSTWLLAFAALFARRRRRA